MASEKRVPAVQVLSLGTPSTQMMYSFGSLATGNRGNGKNLWARGESSSLLGHLETSQIKTMNNVADNHLKSPSAAEGLQPAYSIRRSGQLQVWIR